MSVVSESSFDARKRLNKDGRPFKKGDIREDGYIFRAYQKKKITNKGFYKEAWLSPEAFANYESVSRKAINKVSKRLRIERREILNKAKEKGCVECGYNEHFCALDFDHIDPSQKEFTIGTSYTSVSLERLYKEIDKCQVLCANCHRIKTYNQSR